MMKLEHAATQRQLRPGTPAIVAELDLKDPSGSGLKISVSAVQFRPPGRQAPTWAATSPGTRDRHPSPSNPRWNGRDRQRLRSPLREQVLDAFDQLARQERLREISEGAGVEVASEEFFLDVA